MRKFAVVLVFSLFFFSCEKETQLCIENTDIPLISKVLIDGEVHMEYSYNNANLVTEEKSKFHYTKHTYNDINQLVKSDFYWDMSLVSSNSTVLEAAMNRKEWVTPDNTPKSISHSLEYNSENHLIQKSFIRTSSNVPDYQKFLYENDRIVRITGYYNNSIAVFTNFEYDDNGNITRQTKFIMSPAGIPELTTTTEYEYDNMQNPYQSFKRLTTPGVFTNSNNITKQTYTLNYDVDPWTDKVQIIEYSYVYNDKGYPVKVNGLTEYVYK
jgi:hypothetical protein